MSRQRIVLQHSQQPEDAVILLQFKKDLEKKWNVERIQNVSMTSFSSIARIRYVQSIFFLLYC